MGCRCGGARRQPSIGRETSNGFRASAQVTRPGEILPGTTWNGPKAKQGETDSKK